MNLLYHVNITVALKLQIQNKYYREPLLGCSRPLPALVLAQQDVTVGAVVLRHPQLRQAERHQRARQAPVVTV